MKNRIDGMVLAWPHGASGDILIQGKTMNTNTTKLYWLHTLSPVHVGTGRGVGYIDLPLHRDKVTNWPLIPGSAFKGVWADWYRATDAARKENKELALAFGRASDSESNQSNAGALIATDAKLVCLPVRSLFGTFAWCTSPLALQYLRRDLECAGQKDLPSFTEEPNAEVAYQTQTSCLSDQGKSIWKIWIFRQNLVRRPLSGPRKFLNGFSLTMWLGRIRFNSAL
jgi:CRISPR/Cas system CMR subunit Cmr4 (Cas7 group RAMP superfamily)